MAENFKTFAIKYMVTAVANGLEVSLYAIKGEKGAVEQDNQV